MKSQPAPRPSVAFTADAATAPTLSNKQRKEQFRANLAAQKDARKKAQAEKEAINARIADKVAETFIKGVAELRRLIDDLQPKVQELAKTDDSLKAVLMRRELHKLRMKFAEKTKVLTVQTKTARACASAVLAASRTKTVTEQQRYEARLVKQAEKLAEQARLDAIAEKAANNPTLPLSHDTRVASVGAQQPILPPTPAKEAAESFLAGVDNLTPRLTQNYANHMQFNTEPHFAN